MSSAVNPQDILYLNALVENGSTVQYDCTPTIVCAGTLSAIVARNTATGQRLEAPLCSTSITKDMLVVNATHASVAWTDSLVSSPTWILSNPVQPITIPWNGSDLPEVSWSNGDSYSVQQLCKAYVGSVKPTVSGGNIPLSGVYITNIDIETPPGESYAAVDFSGPAVFMNQSVLGANVYTRFDSTQLGTEQVVFNSVSEEPLSTTANLMYTNQFGWKGGILRQPYPTTVSMYIEAGTYLEGSIYVTSGYFRDTYIAAGAYAVAAAGNVGVTFGVGGSAGLWGPGNLDVLPTATMYLIGGGVAELQYLTGQIYFNGKADACSMTNTATPGLTCGIPITAGNIDAYGFLFSPMGASIQGMGSPF